ncbi:MAG: D-alanine--D-alanine ligase family protein [Thermoanaerobaculia bacterium]
MENVGILFGGPSVEHEVSIVSARGVLDNIDRKSFNPVPLYQDREKNWYSPSLSLKVLEGKKVKGRPQSLEKLIEEYDIKLAFPLIHGTFGEDGTIQGWLEALNIKYVGCGVKASAIGMDKEVSKKIWERDGLPVVPYLKILKENYKEELEKIKNKIEYPVFVKPADSGSSVGITKVKEEKDLKKAIDKAFKITRKILIEKAIEGREIEVSVLGSYEPELISPPGEIVPSKEFYDYEDKYKLNKAGLLVPAPLSEELVLRFKELAKKAFVSIDGYGMARVDFFLEKNRKIYINEINTIPGFTPISMYPKLLSLCGLSYGEVITKLLKLAYNRKQVF